MTSDTAKGNLVEPLSRLQIFGVWPEGDFRFEPDDMLVTYVLVGIVALAALLCLVFAWRRRATGLLVFVGGTVAAGAAIVAVGSPWIDAKALATASPAMVFAALVGAGLLAAGGRRVEGAVVAVLVCGGVLWSNVLAYNEVNLAPHDRHLELEQIGDRIAGEGPALMTEYEPYGVRHFLREADAEGASELRRRVVPLRSGRPLRKLGTADIDEFELAGIRAYRTLVLRRSPVASRPPSVYRLLSRGRFYDVWQLAPGLRGLASRARPAGPARRAGGATALRAGAGARPPRRGRGRAACRRTRSPGRAGRHGRRRHGSQGQTRPVPGMPGAVYPGKEARFDATVTRAAAGPAPDLRRGARSGESSSSRSTGGGSRPGGTASTTTDTTSRWARSSWRGAHTGWRSATAPPSSRRAAVVPQFPLGPLYVVAAREPARGSGAARTGRAPVWPAAGLDRVRQPLSARPCPESARAGSHPALAALQFDPPAL